MVQGLGSGGGGKSSLRTEIVQVPGPKIPVESLPAPRCREPLLMEYQHGTVLVRFSGNTWPLQDWFVSLQIDGGRTDGIFVRQTRPLQDGVAADEALLQDIHKGVSKTCCRLH